MVIIVGDCETTSRHPDQLHDFWEAIRAYRARYIHLDPTQSLATQFPDVQEQVTFRQAVEQLYVRTWEIEAVGFRVMWRNLQARNITVADIELLIGLERQLGGWPQSFDLYLSSVMKLCRFPTEASLHTPEFGTFVLERSALHPAIMETGEGVRTTVHIYRWWHRWSAAPPVAPSMQPTYTEPEPAPAEDVQEPRPAPTHSGDGEQPVRRDRRKRTGTPEDLEEDGGSVMPMEPLRPAGNQAPRGDANKPDA